MRSALLRAIGGPFIALAELAMLVACSCGSSPRAEGLPDAAIAGTDAAPGEGAAARTDAADVEMPGTDADTCDADPLRTGATDRAHTDDFDCLILRFTEKYQEPDAMIMKAIIRIESGFEMDAVGCTAPCGTPEGWSEAEVRCLGLMQIVMACNPKPTDLGMLPSGHPNMSLDTSSPLWQSSIFHPAINIERGVAGIAGNRQEVVAAFPGCTENQYTLMAIGNYNRHGTTKGCDQFNREYTDIVMKYYRQYVAASGWPARPY